MRRYSRASLHAAAAVLEREHAALRVFVAQLGAPTPILTSTPHLHVHVLPLYEDGEEARPSRVFSFSSAVYTYEPGEAEGAARDLRAAVRLQLSGAAASADRLSRPIDWT